MSNERARYISRCAYEGIEFPTTSVRTQWGHDSVKHSAYRRPGVENETTGRKPLVVTVECAFINSLRGWGGNLFPARFKRLIDKIKDTPNGVFTHPTRGFMDVHIDDVSEPIDAKSPLNGAYVTLQLTENNATASLQLSDQGTDTTRSSIGDPGTAVKTRAATVDTLLSSTVETLGLNVGTSTLPPELVAADGSFAAVCDTQLTFLESDTRTFVEAKAAIAVMRRSAELFLVDGSPFSPIEAHDLRAALEALRAAINTYEDDYIGNVQPTRYVVQSPMTVARVSAVVYGTPTKASLIRAANELPNALFLPPGTELVILPA
jgi:hypothetical protein